MRRRSESDDEDSKLASRVASSLHGIHCKVCDNEEYALIVRNNIKGGKRGFKETSSVQSLQEPQVWTNFFSTTLVELPLSNYLCNFFLSFPDKIKTSFKSRNEQGEEK